jgi:signal recognition particle subunit SEC65
VSNKSKAKGNEGERNHRRILSEVWPNIKNHDDKYHPTKDHDGTGRWHVESKKRKTWNIKDVVRQMENEVPEGEPWLIMYEDSNRKLKDNPSGVYAILPAELFVELMYVAQTHYLLG